MYELITLVIYQMDHLVSFNRIGFF